MVFRYTDDLPTWAIPENQTFLQVHGRPWAGSYSRNNRWHSLTQRIQEPLAWGGLTQLFMFSWIHTLTLVLMGVFRWQHDRHLLPGVSYRFWFPGQLARFSECKQQAGREWRKLGRAWLGGFILRQRVMGNGADGCQVPGPSPGLSSCSVWVVTVDSASIPRAGE